jgi:transposase-like protein
MCALAKYWLRVLSELKNRGVQDVLIVVCDGLKHLPDSIGQVWPQTIVQTCVVHLLRNTYAYASRKDWAEIAKDLKPVYTAPSEQAALDRFAEFSDKWEKRYPAIIRLWTNAWAEFVPFLQFDHAIRQVIYTTNAIVISSDAGFVFDVFHGVCDGRFLRAGRGYLQRSMKQNLGSWSACHTGGFTGLVA